MALKVNINPLLNNYADYEQCCICGIKTRYWYDPRDVALCTTCAKTAKSSEIPTKIKWFASCLQQKEKINRAYRVHGSVTTVSWSSEYPEQAIVQAEIPNAGGQGQPAHFSFCIPDEDGHGLTGKQLEVTIKVKQGQ